MNNQSTSGHQPLKNQRLRGREHLRICPTILVLFYPFPTIADPGRGIPSVRNSEANTDKPSSVMAAPAPNIDSSGKRAARTDDKTPRVSRALFEGGEGGGPSDSNFARSAEYLFKHDHDRFEKYRNYVRVNNEEVAREISANEQKFKVEPLQDWVRDQFGEVTNPTALTKRELADVAAVAAGFTLYGPEFLGQEYNDGYMDHLKNQQYNTKGVFKGYEHQKLRKASKSKHKDKKAAAHYVGRKVALELNNELPPELRVDADKLAELVNIQKNMDMYLHTTNNGLHKDVDTRLLDKNTQDAHQR